MMKREQLWLWRLIDVSQVEKFLICDICKVVTSHQRFRRINFVSFSSSYVSGNKISHWKISI